MDGWITRKFHSHSDGSFTINHVQDVEPILDRNKQFQNLMPQTKSETLGRHLASIPLVVWQKWNEETGGQFFKMNKVEQTKFIKRKLADPDNKFLRAY